MMDRIAGVGMKLETCRSDGVVLPFVAVIGRMWWETSLSSRHRHPPPPSPSTAPSTSPWTGPRASSTATRPTLTAATALRPVLGTRDGFQPFPQELAAAWGMRAWIAQDYQRLFDADAPWPQSAEAHRRLRVPMAVALHHPNPQARVDADEPRREVAALKRYGVEIADRVRAPRRAVVWQWYPGVLDGADGAPPR